MGRKGNNSGIVVNECLLHDKRCSRLPICVISHIKTHFSHVVWAVSVQETQGAKNYLRHIAIGRASAWTQADPRLIYPHLKQAPPTWNALPQGLLKQGPPLSFALFGVSGLMAWWFIFPNLKLYYIIYACDLNEKNPTLEPPPQPPPPAFHPVCSL